MKWNAWMLASTFSKEEAMARYVSVALGVVKSRGELTEKGNFEEVFFLSLLRRDMFGSNGLKSYSVEI